MMLISIRQNHGGAMIVYKVGHNDQLVLDPDENEFESLIITFWNRD